MTREPQLDMTSLLNDVIPNLLHNTEKNFAKVTCGPAGRRLLHKALARACFPPVTEEHGVRILLFWESRTIPVFADPRRTDSMIEFLDQNGDPLCVFDPLEEHPTWEHNGGPTAIFRCDPPPDGWAPKWYTP